MSGQRVGVVGDERGLESVLEAVERSGGEAVVAPADELGSVSVVLAVGEAAVVDLAREAVDAPMLPVDAGAGIGSVPPAEVETALEGALRGDCPTERHPVVSATGAFGELRAVFDVALMAGEPARISEFSVRCDDERVGRFRADGVVTSTPAGSPGYNRSAGGPVLAAETDVLSVVPVAPFATAADRWVLPLENVSVAVERDETPVELLVDGRTERTVATGDPIALSHAFDLEVVVAAARERPLGNDRS